MKDIEKRKVLESLNQIGAGVNAQIKGLGELKNSLMKDLTPEEKLEFAQFESTYFKLISAGKHEDARLFAEKMKAEK